MLRKLADQTQGGLPTPTPPAAGSQVEPKQDAGTRPARALPYQPSANASLNAAKNGLALTLGNAGAGAVNLQVYANNAMTGYDVAPATTNDPFDVGGAAPYAVTVHGPNGFLAAFAGDAGKSGAGVEVEADLHHSGELRLIFTNGTKAAVDVSVASLLPADSKAKPTVVHVAAGHRETLRFEPLDDAHGWYDLAATVTGDASYLRRFAGHVENGKPSITG
jgi:phospholipase C